MDVDDDDAFLYGDEPSPPAQPARETPSGVKVEVAVKPETTNSSSAAGAAAAAAPLVPSRVSAALGVSSAMAASLAAYGIDPSAAVVEPTLEDGAVEEDDEEESSDSDDDEDDIKMVFTGQTGRALDLRKPQQAPSNVIGIGKWAHTSAGQAAAAAPVVSATPPRPTPATRVSANQTTEYNPASRPVATPTPVPGSNTYPQIPPSGDSGTAPSISHPAQQPFSAGAPSVPHHPPSDLPQALAASSHPSVDPLHPTGIIPSTGNSVYDLDLAMFEGSGQPWRRPGSDLTDWFNFGFDESSFPKFLRFRAEMEAGRNAMMNAPPMAPITPEVLHMLNLSLPPIGNGNMSAPAQANQANNFNLNPQMMQQMQQMMSMQGMDMGMMSQMMGNMGGVGNMAQNGQMGGLQGQGQLGAGQIRPNQVQRPSATPGPVTPAAPEGSEEVKQEELDPTAEGYVEGNVPPAGLGLRGRGMMRGVPTRGGLLRGRGAAPLGPRAAAGPIPTAPKGPKAGRFKDKDRVESSVSGGLDYGGGGGTEVREADSGSARRGRSRSSSGDRSRGRSYTHSRSSSPTGSGSPDMRRKSGGTRRSEEEGEYTESKSRRSSRRSESPHAKSSRRSRSTKEKEREKEKEKERYKERERAKRKRDDGSLSAGLGPGGWGEDGEEVEDRRSRRRRSYSSVSEEDGHKSKTASSKRR